MWQQDAERDESTKRLAALIQNPSTVTTQCGRTTSTYLLPITNIEKVFSNVRKTFGRKPGDKMEDLDVNRSIWRMIPIVTQQAAVHLGIDYLDDTHSTQNQSHRTVKQLFVVTTKLVKEQKEIQGVSLID